MAASGEKNNKQKPSDAVQTSQDMDDFKNRYYAALSNYYESQLKPVIKPWTRQKILEVIQHVKNATVTMKVDVQRTGPKTYWHLRYDVTQIAEEDCLVKKKENPNCPTIRVVPYEDYFDVLLKVHKDCKDSCSINEIQNIIENDYIIAKKGIELFVSLCPVCNKRKIGIGDYYRCGQIDLIDMQSVPDGPFKWILNYKDLKTKFVHLRPLCTKEASEVALELLKIFLEFGVPSTLQSGNGMEFTAKIIEEVVQWWPECKVIQNIPHNPQLQDSYECSDEDVETMVWTWMRDNLSPEWVTGCFFVQFSKNTLVHKVLGISPFQAQFQSESRQSSFSEEMKKTIAETEISELFPSNSSIIPNSLQEPSEPTPIAKKHKIDSQYSDTPIVRTESRECSQCTLSATPLHQKSKRRNTTLLEPDCARQRSRSKSSELSPTISSHCPPYKPTSPIYKPTSPTYKSTSPTYNASSPTHKPTSPTYNATSPPYNATSPPYIPTSPTYNPTSPTYKATSPPCKPTSQTYNATSPTYKATTPPYKPTSPPYKPTSPTYNVTSPPYKPTSPTYNATSPTYNAASPTYNATSPPCKPTTPTYNATSPTYNAASPTYNAPSPTYKPTSPIYNATSPTYKPISPTYNATSPTYNATSPPYIPTSPTYNATSPTYNNTSPPCKPTSPTYNATSPTYNATSPTYNATSPTYNVTSPPYNTTFIQYNSPSHNPSSPT